MSEFDGDFDYQSSDEDCNAISNLSPCDPRPQRPKRIFKRGTAWTFQDIWVFKVQTISARDFQGRKRKAQEEIKRLFLLLLEDLKEKILFVTIFMDCDSLLQYDEDDEYKIPYRCYVQSIQVTMSFLQTRINMQVSWTSIPGGLNESKEFQNDLEPSAESRWEQIIIHGELRIRNKAVNFSIFYLRVHF